MAPAPGTSFRLFELDTKTSIPVSKRDLTDGKYFHGSAIVRAKKLAATPELVSLLASPATFAMPPAGQKLSRHGMYGLRYKARSGKTVDILFSHDSRPPFLELANRGFLVIRPEASTKLEKLLASALQGVAKRRLPRCAVCPRSLGP